MNTSSIIGVDEVNYSPSLCGDCVVCAVYSFEKVEGATDSKKLSSKKRLELFGKLQEKSLYAVVPATVNQIGQVGIYKARNYAIVAAVSQLLECLLQLKIFPEIVEIDGYWSSEWMSIFQRTFGITVIRGYDESDYEVGAASIIARVYADALFTGFGKFYPGYGMEKDHGSPSVLHCEFIRKNGVSPIHRYKNYAEDWWKKILQKAS